MAIKRLKQHARSLLGILGLASAFTLGTVENIMADGDLIIVNRADGNPTENYVKLQFSSDPQAQDYVTSSGGDGPFIPPMDGEPSICSFLNGTRLSIDERTNNPTNLPFHVDLVFNGVLDSDTANSLYFEFPDSANTFDGKIMEIWETDSNGNSIGATNNIREIITYSNGVMNVGMLVAGDQGYPTPYKHFAVNIRSPPTFNVNIENGSKYGLNPTNFFGVYQNGSVTTTAANVYYYYSTDVSTRTKITGLKEKL